MATFKRSCFDMDAFYISARLWIDWILCGGSFALWAYTPLCQQRCFGKSQALQEESSFWSILQTPWAICACAVSNAVIWADFCGRHKMFLCRLLGWLLLNNLKLLPSISLKSAQENDSPDKPIQTHGIGNPHHTKVHCDAEQDGKHKPYHNGGKQGNNCRKFHIPCCP